MKVIELTQAETGKRIMVNIEDISMVNEFDNSCEIELISGGITYVSEAYDVIFEKLDRIILMI